MERIEEILDGVKTMGIGGHVRPDGDCVGSCMALYLYIKKWYPEIKADIYLEKPKPVFGHIACMDEVHYEAQRGQRTVAEAEEPGVDVPLVALDTLALQVQLGFGGHDGLNIIRLGQGVHVHVVIDHQQAALQISTGKAVVLHFLDAAVAGGISHEPLEHQPDAGLALAALADNEHHLLSLGAGNQAVAQILLQGGDVGIVQQLVQKGQPAVRAGGFGVISHR